MNTNYDRSKYFIQNFSSEHLTKQTASARQTEKRDTFLVPSTTPCSTIKYWNIPYLQPFHLLGVRILDALQQRNPHWECADVKNALTVGSNPRDKPAQRAPRAATFPNPSKELLRWLIPGSRTKVRGPIGGSRTKMCRPRRRAANRSGSKIIPTRGQRGVHPLYFLDDIAHSQTNSERNKT